MNTHTHTEIYVNACMHTYIQNHDGAQRRVGTRAQTAERNARAATLARRSAIRFAFTQAYITQRAAAGVPGTGGPRSLSRAPQARSRGLAQAPEPLVRVLQSRAHRARRAAPAHGGAGRRGPAPATQLVRAGRRGPAPATHPIACFEMLCFDRKIRGTGVLSKTRELG